MTLMTLKQERLYSLDMIHGALELLFTERNSFHALRPYLPYLIQPVEDFWLPINRDYKPLGVRSHTTHWVDYKDYRFLAIPEELIDLSHEHCNKERNTKYAMADGAIFFFSDRTTPILKKEKQRYGQLIREILFEKWNKQKVEA